MTLLIALLAGAVGGIIAGYLLKNFDLGLLWNAVAGVVGGGIGSAVLGWLSIGSGGSDVSSIVYMIVAGVIGGAVILVIAGLVIRAFNS